MDSWFSKHDLLADARRLRADEPEKMRSRLAPLPTEPGGARQTERAERTMRCRAVLMLMFLVSCSDSRRYSIGDPCPIAANDWSADCAMVTGPRGVCTDDYRSLPSSDGHTGRCYAACDGWGHCDAPLVAIRAPDSKGQPVRCYCTFQR